MKKKLLIVVQAAITIGILYWIFSDPRMNISTGLKQIDPIWLLPALGCFALQLICGALRWYFLVRVQDLKLSAGRTIAITFVGYFFNLFLPGGTGGDIIRAWYIFQEEPRRKTVGILTLAMDRIIGLLALVVISFVVISLRYDWLTQSPGTTKLLWVLMAILFASVGLLATSLVVTGFKLQHKLPKKFPARESLIELASAFDLYARRPAATSAAMVLSAICHTAYFSAFYFMARAFSAQVSFIDMFSIMPIVGVISALPLSLSGVGVREKLFQEMLVPLCGTEPGVAVLISIFGFFLWVCCASVGGIIFMVYKPSRGAHIPFKEMWRDASKDVSKVEHDVAKAD